VPQNVLFRNVSQSDGAFPVVDVVPLGVVVHPLGLERHASHEPEGRVKVGEEERLQHRVPVQRQRGKELDVNTIKMY
jgi:hypothetical protein